MPASFMQQVMHYIFTCLELAKLDKYKMQSLTNTKCESRQMKKPEPQQIQNATGDALHIFTGPELAKLNKYKMLMHRVSN